MAFDYGKLRGKIVEVYGSQAAFAKAMGISQRTLSSKMQNKIFFRQDEINKAINLLHLSLDEAKDYFFTPKVQEVEF